MNGNTDIDLVSKALTDFNAVEAGLQVLREQFSGVLFDVTTTAGMDDAKKARATLREPRYEVERIRKAAKAPLLALGKKLDEDAKRITAEIAKLEEPIDQQIKREEERKEREKQERIAAETSRVQLIQERITELRAVVTLRFGEDAALVLDHIGDIERIAIDDSFAEFTDQAADAKAASLARLREIHAGIIERANERARIEAERATLAEEQRKQQEAMAAENARLAKEREALERQQEALRKTEEAAPAPRANPGKGSRGRKPQRPSDAEILDAVAAYFGVSPDIAREWLAAFQVAA